jgi:UDP-glucose 4-epimerase
MKVLVTGGLGYIGSHACVVLLQTGHEVVVVDNLSASHVLVIDRIQKITEKRLSFYKADIRDVDVLSQIFAKEKPDAVMHFAGSKSVGESVREPLFYYENNVWASVCLAKVMREHGCRHLVFSSSATVYGSPDYSPIPESAALRPMNPYGQSKRMIEDVFRDLAASESGWQIALLRYFNPVGAHESGMIGEAPQGHPNNLVPFITQVAVGERSHLSVFGADYETSDGTGVRDYLHVMDLVEGHLAALNWLMQQSDKSSVAQAFNLGTGKGTSVLELLNTFIAETGCRVPYEVVARRPGDVASYFADPVFAQKTLAWSATRDVAAMCRDAWRWQQSNPQGYSAD